MLDTTQTCSQPLAAPLAVVGDVRDAIVLAVRDRDATVHLFGVDWDAVDRARERIDAAGLGSRIVARHMDALRLVRRAASHFRWTN